MEFPQRQGMQRVLNALDLTVARGQLVSLLGPSGCGKSTLLRVVAGLQATVSGSVRIDGKSVDDAREQLAFVFQDASLLPWRTVWQNVRLPLELRPRHATADHAMTIPEALALVGFQESDWHKKPSQLSGGMRMRASIARALITDPKVLLLDEPFAALDDMLRSKLNDLLLQIVERSHATMLFVTHNIAEAIYLSHSIAVMSRGSIASVLPVPLPFPRTQEMRSSPEFAKFYGEVMHTLTRSER